ncbi:MAG: 3-deoxy-D-manno-octulosonate 8-phosphate phosphatase, partial [Gammaproteobacteria bacterium]|nr:3-deoxy-D-manno-octulosonate 8-phosphate phosphatase [Gammaproteobacteria bacterium]
MEDSSIKKLAKDIQLLICDVDGVLTKGEIYLDNSDLEMKA